MSVSTNSYLYYRYTPFDLENYQCPSSLCLIINCVCLKYKYTVHKIKRNKTFRANAKQQWAPLVEV